MFLYNEAMLLVWSCPRALLPVVRTIVVGEYEALFDRFSRNEIVDSRDKEIDSLSLQVLVATGILYTG